ncbi:MAG: YCF48-related protein [Actinomycetota bacterium]|nr:YCF48-related protein [Actinomycetota bacterium]
MGIILFSALALMLGCALSSVVHTQVKADTNTGWYEQQSGTTEDLRGVSAVNASNAWAVGDSGTILKTTDGGVNWISQESGTTEDLWGVSSLDPNTAWAVGSSGTILKTINGGVDWMPQTSGVSYDLREVSAVDANTAWAIGNSSKILKTINGGNIWTAQASGTIYALNGLCAVDTENAWAVGSVNILRTTDGGTTWQNQSQPPGSAPMAVSAVDTKTAWVVGYFGDIAKTVDGGVTWTPQESGISERLWGVSSLDSTTAWAVGGEVGDARYYRVIVKTDDGGATWKTQASEYTQGLFDVAAVNENTAWAVGGQGTVLRTEGGGKDFIWYFAEGYTGQGFQEYLCLGNPQEDKADTKITYMFNDGSSQEQVIEIPPLSRITVNVNQEVGEGREVSATVLSDKDIVVERPMYFNYNGVCAGGHDTKGAHWTSNRWYFAEGYTGLGFDEWLCVLNPGDSPAELTFGFQTQEEGLTQRAGYSVSAHSRESFRINDVLGSDYQTSLRLSSDQPVVAERSMYFDYTGTNNWHWQGGHCVMGIPSLAREYYFAEGTTRSGFEEWITLQNPNPGTTEVQATYHLGASQGDSVSKTYSLPAGTRQTFFVPSEVGTEKDVSVYLTSEDDFLVERPMYFDYRFNISAQGGHCVIGSTTQAYDWFFGEGYTGAGFDEWICMQNPGEEEAVVEAIYFTQEEGALEPRVVTVPAKTRKTIMVNDHAGNDYQLSCGIVVTSGPNVVVERPIYFNHNGVDGGHDVVGYVP